MNGELLKGQKELVLKNGEKLVIEYTMNSLVELEKQFGSFKEITKVFKDVKFENILFLIYAGTIDNQTIDIKHLGRYFDLGNFKQGVEVVQECFKMAFPNSASEEDGMTDKGREILEQAKKKD